MVNLPWHLQILGLSGYADDRAVRRAYAKALRAIDPASDPAAFEQLRAAYEAARAWCDEHSADATPGTTETVAVQEPQPANEDVPASEPTTDTLPRIDDLADALALQLINDASGKPPEAMEALLAGALASLRLRYVDAPGQLEDRVVDLMMHASITNRAALFDAAAVQFHWDEVDRVAATGPRRRWVEAVLAQRETWHRIEAGWRADWLALMARAHESLDNAIVRRWPDIGRLASMLPQWITLHLTAAELSAWRGAFDALPRDTRDEYAARAAPATALLPARKTRRGFEMNRWWLLIWGLGLMVSFVLHMADYQRGRQTWSPSSVSDPTDTPRQCVELHERLDKPDAFNGLVQEEIARLKRRAHRCALGGHWHAAGPPYTQVN